MMVTVAIATATGPRAYTGHIVCRGPSTMEMLLTDPFPMAGRTVQFPLTSVVSELPTPPRRADAAKSVAASVGS